MYLRKKVVSTNTDGKPYCIIELFSFFGDAWYSFFGDAWSNSLETHRISAGAFKGEAWRLQG